MHTAAPAAFSPRIRWSWLSNPKADILWNLAPFWAGYVVAAALFAVRGDGAVADNSALNLTVGSAHIHIGTLAFMLYGPLVDAPHLWATVARTYTDPQEWAQRRRLFLASFVWFIIGPTVIVLPYVVSAIWRLPTGSESLGWVMWGHFFTLYALFHINKQHWGFVALYKRKNNDLGNARENRIDQLFFYLGIWLPFAAMMTSPWFIEPDGTAIAWMQTPALGKTLGGLINPLCHVGFFAVCAAYTVFQVLQWQRGVARNGPKLAYLATVIPLQYVAFSMDPFVAAFWVIITGFGHCAQYHRIVWTYGEKHYVAEAAPTAQKGLPTRIFSNVWLYVVFGLIFSFVTLQGPGAGIVAQFMGRTLDAGVFRRVFSFISENEGVGLGVKMTAAFISGVRLHHFYVDSKIWRVSKSPSLAKSMNVELPSAGREQAALKSSQPQATAN